MGGVCSAAIESENVVGYSGKTSNDQNNFVTVPFNTISYNTSDIQQIRINDGGAGTIGWGTEIFEIWEGAPTLVDGVGYCYLDKTMDPTGKATDYYWGSLDGTKADFSIAAGQGVVINCASDLDVTTSGQVPTEPVIFTSVAQNNFTGNPFPQAIDIQAIKISDDGAGTIGWGTEIFEIWEGAPTLVDGVGYCYLDKTMDPTGKATDYYWGSLDGTKAEYSIAPNQGVVINCAAGLTVTINPPYSL